MALKAILEVAIHIQAFRNIDLFLQGLYYIKVSVAQVALPYTQATPYQIIECSSDDADPLSFPCAHSHISEKDKTICTRAFYIRFNEEEINIENLFLFRLEVDTHENFQHETLKITFQLYFLDVLVYSDVPSEDYKVEDELKTYSLTSEASIDVRNAGEGVSEFCPVVFDDQHFCVANVVVHTGLVDYQLRTDRKLVSEELNIPKIVSDILFPNQEIVDEATINQVNLRYVQILAHNHERMRVMLQQLLSRCVDPESGPELEDLPPPLQLPEYRSPIYKPPTEGYTPTFSEAVCTNHPETIANAVYCESKFAAGHLFTLYHYLLQLIERKSARTAQFFQDQYRDLIKMRASDSFIKVQVNVTTVPAVMTKDKSKEYEEAAKTRRAQIENVSYLSINEECFYSSGGRQPVFFEETYCAAGQEWAHETRHIRKNPGVHLIVIVHGFQGNSFDVRLIKNNLSVLFPSSLLLCSEANENGTEDDINVMGERLANEVMEFIQEHCPRYVLGRLSFIAHSLGGLIVRAALIHLAEYREVMHLYLTLSTPHLGYTRSDSRLISSGMWIITRLNPSTSLKQLTLQDEGDLKNSVIYQLSSYSGLGWFKQVILVSSHQDQYSPADSSRIQVSPGTRKDPRGPVFVQMAENILAQISTKALKRVDVDFTLERGLDSWIGRKAHIEFLENQTVIRTIICKYPDLFS